MNRHTLSLLLLCAAQAGCSTYQYAKNVKLIAFEDDISHGKSVGPVRGESCQAHAMGVPIGEPVSLDRALAKAREEQELRYLNNVSTESRGFNSFFYGKRCLSVKGTGYQ